MECKKCGASWEEETAVCPECGQEVESQEAAEILEPVEEQVLEEVSEEVTEEVTEEITEETTEEQAEEAPAKPKNKKLMRVVAIVCCIALALSLGLGIWVGVNGGLKPRENNVMYRDDYTAEGEKLAAAMDNVVATVDGEQLTNEQLQVYYWSEVFRFLQENSSYLSYFGLDLTKSLADQMVSEGISYQQYLLNSALNNWHSYQVLVKLSKEADYEMSEAMRSELDGMQQSLAATAAYYGFDSVDALIKEDMGAGASEKAYMEYLELYFTAMDYFDHLYLEATPDDATIEAHYAANQATIDSSYGVSRDSGKLVDVRHILIMPKGGTTDENGQTVYSDEEWETCRQDAQAILDQWAAGAADEAYFAELANTYSEDPGSNTAGGLYTNVYTGQMVVPFDAWCFDESRQTGDTGLVQTSYGYHVMFYVDGEEGWIRAARQDYLSGYCQSILQAAREENPMEVTFKNIRLGNVELS